MAYSSSHRPAGALLYLSIFIPFVLVRARATVHVREEHIPEDIKPKDVLHTGAAGEMTCGLKE